VRPTGGFGAQEFVFNGGEQHLLHKTCSHAERGALL